MKQRILFAFTLVISLCLLCGCDKSTDIDEIAKGDLPSWMRDEINDMRLLSSASSAMIDSVKTQVYSNNLDEEKRINIRLIYIFPQASSDQEYGQSRYYNDYGTQTGGDTGVGGLLDIPNGELLWEITESHKEVL